MLDGSLRKMVNLFKTKLKALKKILKTKIRINGAGRTDKGVHAFGQYANFTIKKKISDKNKFISSINFFLRKEFISILSIKKVKDEISSKI